MGFPEPLARAQRDAMRATLLQQKLAIEEQLDNLRAGSPHHVALEPREYHRLIEYLVIAGNAIVLALDEIDLSLARLAREHDKAELARAEREEAGKEE